MRILQLLFHKQKKLRPTHEEEALTTSLGNESLPHQLNLKLIERSSARRFENQPPRQVDGSLNFVHSVLIGGLEVYNNKKPTVEIDPDYMNPKNGAR